MATNNADHLPHLFVSCLLTLFCFCEFCYCFHPKQVMNLSTVAVQWSPAEIPPKYQKKRKWSPAGATWNGSPDGAGSDGGACGYGDAVLKPPFNSMITDISPSLTNSATDVELVTKCKYNLNVPCDYTGTTSAIAFRVDVGSNPYYFAVAPQFEEGDGDLVSVDLKEATSTTTGPDDQWKPMQQSWGAVWKLESGSALQALFSIRLTSGNTGRILVANNVIPAGWQGKHFPWEFLCGRRGNFSALSSVNYTAPDIYHVSRTIAIFAASYTQCSIIYILSRNSSCTRRRQIHALNGQCDGHDSLIPFSILTLRILLLPILALAIFK
ncbi:hypothetical protein RHMOL_Rhmol03G0188900 [Rhododendron molle]|uniref:Uncharacterized protein n=1 Tax=Rhododendron molle TaxID=49168 RepID=A0ACC0PHA1_RHOML|nr:hypothetical protein RHMOL_Rhmol03G0188900 [Rhododendron molle]